ncbi:MAG: coenzyme F420-0:L-glutamate ligase [Candidatus Thorarchaeota archaeon]|jgi:coenzyme F420-0:L-glutamate ligase/coenzyme F420-1:gamma-L-glutamate ligase
MMNDRQIHLIPIQKIPLVKVGDSISDLILSALRKGGIQLNQGDVLVVAHSIVSIAEGKVYHLEDLEVSERAMKIAERIGQPPERVEVAIREASEVLKEEPVFITRTKQGIITDFAGVDESNAPPGTFVTLPDDPDKSAKRISDSLSKSIGFNVPVIITDTQGRPWRKGAVNLAIGVAGMSPFTRNVGKEDLYGHKLKGSLVCLADQLASSAELVMGQAGEGIPVVIVRGVDYVQDEGKASEILRSESENLFS